MIIKVPCGWCRNCLRRLRRRWAGIRQKKRHINRQLPMPSDRSGKILSIAWKWRLVEKRVSWRPEVAPNQNWWELNLKTRPCSVGQQNSLRTWTFNLTMLKLYSLCVAAPDCCYHDMYVLWTPMKGVVSWLAHCLLQLGRLWDSSGWHCLAHRRRESHINT